MAGKYKTKQQAAIRECLELNKDSYVTVSEIEKYLKNNNYSVGLTTIYRHLEKMEQDGIVARINVEKQTGACYRYIANEAEDGFYIECEEMWTGRKDGVPSFSRAIQSCKCGSSFQY